MDGNETSHPPQGNDALVQSPSSNQNRFRRRSSFTKPFSGLRRMSSRLVPSNWTKETTKYETIDSTANLLEDPPRLPGIPSLLSKGNESKESFLSSLDKLADRPGYLSNPAPGLGHKKANQVTNPDKSFDNLNKGQSSGPPDSCQRRVPSTRTTSSSLIPRYSNAPILFPSLMAPIRPGEQSQRGMARSSTTGNLEQRKAAYKEARSRKGNPANYMRPTSSSIARRNSAVPSPPLSVPPSTRRRPSAEYPLGIKIDRASTPGIRLSSSNSSRALRANVKSDLPFRELYGTKADEIKVQTASRAARFMVDTEDQVQTANNAQGSTTSSNTQQAAPTPSGPSSEFTVTYDPGQEADFNSVKSPEFQITPILNPGEVAEASEAAFHDSPGHTPLNLMGLQHMSFPAGGLGKSKLRQNALDSPLSEPETVIYQPETSVKQGKRREQHAGVDADLFATHNRQHENMGYYDEEGYTAPTKQDESTEESCEGDTIIRGGIGDVDTNSGRSIIMRANTVSPSLLEEEDEDDPRNVSKAPFALPPPFFCPFLSKALPLARSLKTV